ncbi:MAG: leucine-rich repeat domain-containing protein [Clostridia bacterium]|nr:leucine-rich repeat domain-containing protein [Clostridia bacterium]
MRNTLKAIVITIIALTIGLFVSCAYSEEETISWQLSDSGVLSVYGNGAIPNNYHPWNDDNSIKEQIKSIVIEEGITQLGYESFRSIPNVTVVSLPATLQVIKGWCFAGCSSLIDINLPEGLQLLDTGCFAGCSFSEINIPSTVTSISITVFQGCPSLVNVNVASGSNSYTSINGVLFTKNGSSLNYYPTGRHDKIYIIPDGTRSIGMYAFYRINDIEEVVLPQGCTTINMLAFMSCSNLSSISIPDSVNSIGNGAFTDCYSLESVTILNDDCTLGSYCIPSSTTIICNKGSKAELFAIENSYHLVYTDGTEYVPVEIDWSLDDAGVLTIMGSGIIENYYHPWIEENEENKYRITSVIINEGITQLGDGMFSGLINLTDVSLPSTVEIIGQVCFENCSSLESITLPEGLTTLSIMSFRGCQSLSTIEIPASVTSIGISCFDGCYSLENIVVSTENSNFVSINGVLFSKGYQRLLCYPCGRPDSIYQVESNTKAINMYAFYNAKALEKIVMPTGLLSIDMHSFMGCTNLNTVILSDTLNSIGFCAFSGCESLESIIIPINVQSIDRTSFSNNTIIIGSENSVAESFAHENMLTFLNVNDLFTNSLPRNTKIVSDEAFLNSAFSHVFIPDSVENIGVNAFNSSTIIICIKGSYADQWAHSYNYPVVCLDSDNR